MIAVIILVIFFLLPNTDRVTPIGRTIGGDIMIALFTDKPVKSNFCRFFGKKEDDSYLFCKLKRYKF